MESVTLENFRCFREKQTVKLAPLTLLVGENSTGKTSFLAMIYHLARLVDSGYTPDFKFPHDLGSFDEIVYNSGGRAAPARQFTIGYSPRALDPDADHGTQRQIARSVTFTKRGTAPALVAHSLQSRDESIDEKVHPDSTYVAQLRRGDNRWTLEYPGPPGSEADLHSHTFGLRYALSHDAPFWESTLYDFVPDVDSPDFTLGDAEALHELHRLMVHENSPRPYWSAPVRSHPQRTYDPARSSRDPEGDHISMYLAEMARDDEEEWHYLKQRIDKFGRDAGLFDELRVRLFGDSHIEPFQIQVRKEAKSVKGPFRNLIDVGYGVSQILPLLVELLRRDGVQQYLLQQPEVHLHPSAQASLGTRFCNAAANGRQLIVETHSDHLMNRIRMDVRDEATALQSDQVIILFFERQDQDVRIHEITIDEQGNICRAPDSYREFFRLESRRSLGL